MDRRWREKIDSVLFPTMRDLIFLSRGFHLVSENLVRRALTTDEVCVQKDTDGPNRATIFSICVVSGMTH